MAHVALVRETDAVEVFLGLERELAAEQPGRQSLGPDGSVLNDFLDGFCEVHVFEF
jgi:hypothetical protein